ncbi:patatin-like phospholipase family protein [Tsukamurella sp. 1534]|uniref:patatin-like phospholipase family protein n=1 Tax=Tsukamurella sp. 1534 TaxID=1151061 RepID=UPI0002E38A9B|nr:patatin-like phospholipase family protein [Tsukamurella sp. 1534]
MNISPFSTPVHDDGDHSHELAVVLAGAGSAGNAWQIGLVAGLADAGIDLTRAGLFVGTSAGSTVAAQITSGVPSGDMCAAILAERHPTPTGDRPSPTTATRDYLDWSNRLIADSADPVDMRRRIGAAALDPGTSGGVHRARWREVAASRLPRHEWPAQRVLIAAVDAESGAPVAFSRHSGVDLVDAVAASTSHGFGPLPPYRIGERHYLSGGYRRNENADLARGYGRVVVLAPFGGRTRTPSSWGMDLAAQIGELRAGGSRVETVVPAAAAGDVFGVNAMDPSVRPGAARGGYEQGRGLADQLAGVWDGLG